MRVPMHALTHIGRHPCVKKIDAIKKTSIIFQTAEGKVLYDHMLRWPSGRRYPVDHSFSVSSLLPTLGLAGIHTQKTQSHSLFFRAVSGCFYEFLFQEVSILSLARQASGSSIVGTFRSEHFLSCSFPLLTVFTQGILKASCMALEALKATPPTAQSEPVLVRSGRAHPMYSESDSQELGSELENQASIH